MSGFLGGLEELYTGGLDAIGGGSLGESVKDNWKVWFALGLVGIIVLLFILIGFITVYSTGLFEFAKAVGDDLLYGTIKVYRSIPPAVPAAEQYRSRRRY